jgi:hypothetical protein
MEESFKKKDGKTTIYTSQPYDSYWSNSSTRAPRAFHSVILAEGLKEELLKGTGKKISCLDIGAHQVNLIDPRSNLSTR